MYCHLTLQYIRESPLMFSVPLSHTTVHQGISTDALCPVTSHYSTSGNLHWCSLSCHLTLQYIRESPLMFCVPSSHTTVHQGISAWRTVKYRSRFSQHVWVILGELRLQTSLIPTRDHLPISLYSVQLITALNFISYCRSVWSLSEG